MVVLDKMKKIDREKMEKQAEKISRYNKKVLIDLADTAEAQLHNYFLLTGKISEPRLKNLLVLEKAISYSKK
jgi:hypothetical protein